MSAGGIAALALPVVAFPLSDPVCVALRHPSAAGCLRLPPVDDEGTGANFIELSMNTIHATTSAEKFYLEPSKQDKGSVHVRCCSNNKYWVAQQHERDGRTAWFICATADEPEEDQAKPSCTLFLFSSMTTPSNDPSLLLNGSKMRLFLWPESKKIQFAPVRSGIFNLELRPFSMEPSPLIRICRLSLQKQLPRYVAFKGSNGKYLTVKDKYLQFSLEDIADPAVVHETFPDEYGTIRIRSNGSDDQFWRLRPEGWICADGEGPAYTDDQEEVYSDVKTLFRINILSGNYVELQSRSNGLYCKRFTTTGMTSGLSAMVYDSHTSSDAELKIEEPVKSREIYDVRYRYGEAKKTITKRELSRTVVIGTNRSDDMANSETTIELFDRSESRWDASLSLDAGVKTSFKASVPFKIVDIGGSFEAHVNIKGEYNWGKTDVHEEKSKTVISYPLLPKTRKICSIFASKKVVDLPFSYKKKDVGYSGEVIHSVELHDGMYHGMEVTEIDYDIIGEHIE